MKVRLDSTLASDLFTFVGRGATHWAIVLGSKQAYSGVQDAARKVGECSQQPGRGLVQWFMWYHIWVFVY